MADVTVPLEGLKNVWAPEWFRDKDGRWQLVLSLSTKGTEGPFAAYYVTPLDESFSRYSAPVPMQGLAATTSTPSSS